MEVLNDLIGYKDLKIFQDTEMFNFSLDSVLLPNFVDINNDCKNILDIGTGNAPIPLILTTLTDAHIYGVEIQEKSYRLACKSVEYNNLKNQITIINDDINEISEKFDNEFFDTIVCNPPFFKVFKNSRLNINEEKTIARHEIKLNLDQIFSICKRLLKTNGNIAMVHRPERLIEIIETMRKYKIEPKRIQFVHPKAELEANCVLIEGVKNGKSGLKVLKSIIAHNGDGSYSSDVTCFFS